MKKTVLLLLTLFILLSACSVQKASTRKYYVLENYNHNIDKKLIQSEPLNNSVLIRRTNVMDTYNRRQIVKRYFGPQLTYSDDNTWATKLSESVPRLIGTRLEVYQIFKEVKFSYELDKPDYELETTIHNVEYMVDERDNINFARLKISFNLKSTETGNTVISHDVDSKAMMQIEDYALFVQEINDIILKETDKFSYKIIAYLNNDLIKEEFLDNLAEQQDDNFMEIPSEEALSSGTGLLFLPALTRTENEPFYTVTDKFGYKQTGVMGETLPLLSGKYTLQYGSGAEIQRMEEEVEIFPRYKTVVKPDWSCLLVTIIDEQRNLVKTRYGVYEGKNGDSYGYEIPADTDIGEKDNVWVLKPGLYKVTINNEAFNTYVDFTTVFLEAGKSQKLTIVVDDDGSGNISVVGAGIMDEDIDTSALANLKVSSAVHGNFNMISNEESENKVETTTNLTAQLENRVVYDSYPVHYNMKNFIEVGSSKAPSEDFKVSSDDFDLKNTVIYYLSKKFGFYSRFDAQSHFFDEYITDSEDFNYIKKDTDGKVISQQNDVDKVLVKQPIYPISLKEGIGVNLRAINSLKVDLYLRGGFGLRQDINKNYFKYTGTDSLGYKIYEEEPSNYTRGIEFSAIGNMQLPFNINYDLNADILLPFDKNESINLDIEQVINMRLLRYLSLDYRLEISYEDTDITDSYFQTNQSLYLRLTYVLR